VGAGFIGAEVAATCHGLGARVTVVEAAATPLAHVLGEEVGAAAARSTGPPGWS
ncbi:MAG: NAD-binding protein, partial [Acidimicrobiales bacterium]